MPKFAANLSTMFTELPFTARFEAAAAAGFGGVEIHFPYDFEPAKLGRLLAASQLRQVLFNAAPGDWAFGDRGLAALDGRDDEFVESIGQALRYAALLDCPRIHVMAGIVTPDDAATARYVERLKFAANEAARVDCALTIEPINGHDIPGYFLDSMYRGVDLLERIDRENVGLQFDIYHAQIMHGDVTRLLRSCADLITHVQIASVPDRCEPDRGELSNLYVLDQVLDVGYEGWIGCEYFPSGDTSEGLGWMEPFRQR